MIGEADQLTPANPFTVHTIAASRFVPITQLAEVADILTSGLGRNRGAGGQTVSL